MHLDLADDEEGSVGEARHEVIYVEVRHTQPGARAVPAHHLFPCCKE